MLFQLSQFTFHACRIDLLEQMTERKKLGQVGTVLFELEHFFHAKRDQFCEYANIPRIGYQADVLAKVISDDSQKPCGACDVLVQGFYV